MKTVQLPEVIFAKTYKLSQYLEKRLDDGSNLTWNAIEPLNLGAREQEFVPFFY